MAANFTNVIKPTHICNLTCSYCYNEDTRSPVMTRETLKKVIGETFEYCRTLEVQPQIDFIWHGGEPAVAGLDFYRDAIAMQKECACDASYHNSFQTNGMLIRPEWVDFFLANKFRVSVSLDGHGELNDKTRFHGNGKGSFEGVFKAIKMMRDGGVPLGICVVISKHNAGRIDEVYEFLAKERLPFNVIPLTRSGDALANFEEIGLAEDEYADPWIKMYDLWFDSSEENYVYCSDFVFKTRAILLGRPQDCISLKNCSSAHISTDPDGNVYPCATLSSNAEWCYGNITESPLAALFESRAAISAKSRQVDPHCQSCKWQHVCHGGCMQRADKFYGTHNTRDYYCDSLYRIYEHIEQRLRSDGSMVLDRLPAPNLLDERDAPPKRALAVRSAKHVVRSRGIPIRMEVI